jgi:adenosylcobinamide-phosphate synthase
LDKARRMLHYIVRRDPTKLSGRQIISATVESVAESTTDGVTSPFFYFALFGVPGAFAFRTVSTLDSMLGYRDREHVNIGWFSASLDTVVNYVPARLTAVLMVVAVFLLGGNWRQSWRVLRRDRGNMASVNAGWTIGVMAGALGVRLEKPGCYALGDGEGIEPGDVLKALRVMELTAVLFGLVVVFPVLVLRVFVFGFLEFGSFRVFCVLLGAFGSFGCVLGFLCVFDFVAYFGGVGHVCCVYFFYHAVDHSADD